MFVLNNHLEKQVTSQVNPQPLFQHYDIKIPIRAYLGNIILKKRRYTVFVVSSELGFLSIIGHTVFKKDYQ